MKKSLASTERKLQTASDKSDAARRDLATVDPSDYLAILEAQERLRNAEKLVTELEDEWIRLSELLS